MDKSGGNMVHENEYKYIISMMNMTNLSEMDSLKNYFTWLNKHNDNLIYSRIDHALANVEWYKKYINVTLNILAPSVSDHSLLLIQNPDTVRQKRQYHFKFLNNVVDSPNFLEEINKCWRVPIHDRPVFVIWRKLIRTQSTIRRLSKHMLDALASLKNDRVMLIENQSYSKSYRDD